jgi:hypothetical protein
MTFTATPTTASSYPALTVQGFSGAISSPLDQTSTSAGGCVSAITTISPGLITTGTPQLLVTGIGAAGTAWPVSSLTIGSGFTLLSGSVENVSAQHYGVAMAYLIQGAFGSANPAWSWTAAGTNATAIASFK